MLHGLKIAQLAFHQFDRSPVLVVVSIIDGKFAAREASSSRRLVRLALNLSWREKQKKIINSPNRIIRDPFTRLHNNPTGIWLIQSLDQSCGECRSIVKIPYLFLCVILPFRELQNR